MISQHQAQELKRLATVALVANYEVGQHRNSEREKTAEEAEGALAAFIDRLSADSAEPRFRATVAEDRDDVFADSVGAEPVLINATSDELCREPDGSIAIDWITKDRDMLSMSLAKDGTLSWAVHRAGPQGCGTAQLNEACFWTLNQCLAEAEALAATSPAPAVPSELQNEALRLTRDALKAYRAGSAEARPGEEALAAINRLAASQQPAATSEPLCACKDRPASQCDEEWGPNCDLGNNAAHVRVSTVDPAVIDAALAHQAEHAEAGEEWAPYLKEGETPLQRLRREIRDSNALLGLLTDARAALTSQAEQTEVKAAVSAERAACLAIVEKWGMGKDVIAEEIRARGADATPSPSQASARAERDFYARDHYEEARRGEKAWPGSSQASEPPQQGERCKCGEKLAADCDEEWGPNCDLGNNAAHVRVSTVDPAVIDAALAHQPAVAEPDMLTLAQQALDAMAIRTTAEAVAGATAFVMAQPAASQEGDAWNIALHEWAVAGWRTEVENRPLVNIHRKRLDDFWRTVIRKAGGDPDSVIGPDHDTLAARDGGAK